MVAIAESKVIINKSDWKKIKSVFDSPLFGKDWKDIISGIEKQDAKKKMIEIFRLGFHKGVNFVDSELGDCISDKINQFEEQEGYMPSGRKVATYDWDKEVEKAIKRNIKDIK